MAPTLVFDRDGRFVAAAGSPGGNLIVGFVSEVLVAMLDWGMDPQQAAADAQTKTGVTVTFLNDATMTEYGVLLALIAVVCISSATLVQPGLTDQLCTIRSKLEAGVAFLQPQMRSHAGRLLHLEQSAERLRPGDEFCLSQVLQSAAPLEHAPPWLLHSGS